MPNNSNLCSACDEPTAKIHVSAPPAKPRLQALETLDDLGTSILDDLGTSLPDGVFTSNPELVPQNCSSKEKVSHPTVSVQIQSEGRPDSHHSSVLPDHSDDLPNLREFSLRPAIDWPPLNDSKAWGSLDAQVYERLPTSGSTEERLDALESNIYEIGVRLFGSKPQFRGRERFVSRRTRETIRLVVEKNALVRDLAVCELSNRDALADLLETVRGKLRANRRSERRMRRRNQCRAAFRLFKRDPFSAGRQVLDAKTNTRLEVSQQVLDAHLSEVCHDPLKDIPLQPLEGLPPTPKVKRKFPTGGFDRSQFLTAVKKKRNKSAPGLNRIPYTVYKKCSNLADYLFIIINTAYLSKCVPLRWRASMENYIPKVPHPKADTIGDFRSIALSNVEGKLFWSLMANRLFSHFLGENKLINKSIQKGCMEKTPGVWEHVSMVWSALQEARNTKGDLAAVWLDIANAYGTIPHELMFFALKRYGVSNHCIHLIRVYYGGLWSKSFSESALSDWHRHDRGIFAGCTLSIALFVAGINVVIEYVSNCQVEKLFIKSTPLPSMRAFMDDMNIMSPTVRDTSMLLGRCCTALKWARMKFKAPKSRSIVIKAGRSLCPAISPFCIPNESEVYSDGRAGMVIAPPGDYIPSIHNNPVKFLGRVIDGSLSDRRSIGELDIKLVTGLKRIDKACFKRSQKLWILHHILIPRIRWPLLIYEVSMSHAVSLEQKISVHIRKWLGISKYVTNICLYSSSSPCPLPFQALSTVLKTSKVGGYQQLKQSTDPAVSAAPPTLKAGRWNATSTSNDAECDVNAKKIIGISQTSRAGFGSVRYERVPRSTQSSAYRKLVTTAVKNQVENEYSAKSVGMPLQCHWTNWVDYIKNDLRWKDILGMPPNLLSFCLNATYNTLPSPANLKRMKIQTEANCFLCGHTPCTVGHILSGCKAALNQRRYDVRHDLVLTDIATVVRNFANDMQEQRPIDQAGIMFIPEGRAVKSFAKRKRGLLRLAQDWEVIADVGDQKNYVFPNYLAQTARRPDILLISQSIKRVIMMELTCGCEENFKGAHSRKSVTYNELVEEIKRNGWGVNMFAIEVGARGYCAESVRSTLSAVGLSGRQIKDLIKKVSRTSLTASFAIWLARETPGWDMSSTFSESRETLNIDGHVKSKFAKDILTEVPLSDPRNRPESESEPPHQNLSWKKPSSSREFRGIANKGATCYANSILQAFLSVPVCWSSLLLSPRSPSTLVNTFVTALTDLAKRKKAFEPQPFLDAVQECFRASGETRFRWNDFQDVPDVLRVIRGDVETFLAGPWDAITATLKQTISCMRCGTESISEHTTTSIQLDLTRSLSDSLLKFSAKVVLENDNLWFCPTCQGLRCAVKRVVFSNVPEVLIIQLNRWSVKPANPTQFCKNDAKIKIMNHETVSVVVDPEISFSQRLRPMSAICHTGSFDRGHYYTYSRHGDSWYKFNDSAVCKVPGNLAYFSSKDPYVVFLRKV